MPLVTVFENVPSGLPMATTSWPTLSSSELPTYAVGRPGLDLHDREVGEAVDTVDPARELAPVLEHDGEPVTAGDDMAVREDPAVRVEDDARSDARFGDREGVRRRRDLARGDDDDRGPDLRGDVDHRRRFVDLERLDRVRVRADRRPARRDARVQCPRRVEREERAGRGENRGDERGREDRAGHARADGADLGLTTGSGATGWYQPPLVSAGRLHGSAVPSRDQLAAGHWGRVSGSGSSGDPASPG